MWREIGSTLQHAGASKFLSRLYKTVSFCGIVVVSFSLLLLPILSYVDDDDDAAALLVGWLHRGRFSHHDDYTICRVFSKAFAQFSPTTSLAIFISHSHAERLNFPLLSFRTNIRFPHVKNFPPFLWLAQLTLALG